MPASYKSWRIRSLISIHSSICASWPTSLARTVKLDGTNGPGLSSTLNNQTGMNFSRWLAIYRVEYLIREFSKCLTQEPQELYKTAGFTSRTSFYRQFKEVTGNTPIEYFANLYYNNVNDSTK